MVVSSLHTLYCHPTKCEVLQSRTDPLEMLLSCLRLSHIIYVSRCYTQELAECAQVGAQQGRQREVSSAFDVAIRCLFRIEGAEGWDKNEQREDGTTMLRVVVYSAGGTVRTTRRGVEATGAIGKDMWGDLSA